MGLNVITNQPLKSSGFSIAGALSFLHSLSLQIPLTQRVHSMCDQFSSISGLHASAL
ncbi:hypothetical protein D3C79_931040 [compost metagenome]